MAGARGRSRSSLHHGDAAGAAAVKDAQASGVGRGRPISDDRLCRTLRMGDSGNEARPDQVGRPHPDGERPKGSGWSADGVLCQKMREPMKVAILDDSQNVALGLADWSAVRRHAEITVFNDHIADPSAVVERLRPFDAICVMRERTPLTREILQQLPNLKVIASTGPRNAY